MKQHAPFVIFAGFAWLAVSVAAQTTASETVTVPAPAPAVLIVTALPVPAALATKKPVFTVYLRERGEVTQWFGAAPAAEKYAHGDSLLRLSLAQRLKHFDYLLEMSNSTELALPQDAVSPITAQGQLGLGGTYYATNNNTYPVAASFKSGFLRYHSRNDASVIRIGRFEFFEGQETLPKNPTMAWLQTNRIAQRLIGNFGFSNAQRSFDGIEAKTSGASWDITAMAGRPTQGVFNMNANKELDVDIQFLSYSRYAAKQKVLFRGFGIGYHDGRPNIVKTDNRALAVRAAEHRNIRIGTFGGDMLAVLPIRKLSVDLMVWGAVQTGRWGTLEHTAGAIAVEGGMKFGTIRTKPWLRGGYLQTTGDNNSADGKHNTFFQLLPTPRVYARYPYYNMMNSTDEFAQVIDTPSKRLEIRTDLHFLQLTSSNDLWYGGGGAFDTKVFGFTGRPANNHSSFSTLYDISADVVVTRQISVTGYYAHAFGKAVISGTYPISTDSNFGYIELNYKFSRVLKHP